MPRPHGMDECPIVTQQKSLLRSDQRGYQQCEGLLSIDVVVGMADCDGRVRGHNGESGQARIRKHFTGRLIPPQRLFVRKNPPHLFKGRGPVRGEWNTCVDCDIEGS